MSGRIDSLPGSAVPTTDPDAAPSEARRRRVVNRSAGLLLLCALLPAEAAVAQFNVLLFFAEGRFTTGMMVVDEAVRAAIDAGAPGEVQYHTEFLELGHYGEAEYEEQIVRFLGSKYASQKIDLVVTVLGSSLRFLAGNRERLFPEAAIVFCMVDSREHEAIGPVRDATGVLADFDFKGTLDAVLALQPETRRVAAVIGASPWERYWDAQAREVFSQYDGRLEFEHLTGLPLPELRERLANLPPDTVVLYEILLRDRDGNGLVPESAAEQVAAASAVPVYGLAETFLGSGIVGGQLVSLDQQGRLAGELALRVLRGEDPATIAPLRADTTRPIFDRRQLDRWGLSAARLPANAEIRFEVPGLWELYKWPIIGVLALVLLQTALISGLLIQRRVRRRAQAEVREIEQRVSVAARAGRLGLWVWDIAHDEFWITEEGRALYGLAGPGPVSFEQFVETLHPGGAAQVRAAVGSALEGKGDYEAEYRMIMPDGKVRWIAEQGRVEFSSNREPVLMRGVSIDVSARKQAELEAQHHRGELAHLNRVGMLGELSASFAHELNQPLAAIMSNAQAALRFLNQNTAEPDELRDILRDIVDDDHRAGQVIERLRALFKRGEPSHQPLDLNEIVTEVLRLLRSDIVTRGITVETDFDAPLPTVTGDRMLLQQVLLNLIVNGCDAMADNRPEDRRLTVRTERVDRDGVAVSVIDCGKGIADDQMEKIFEPFVTTKTQGTGLGLSISRSIMAAHGGRLGAVNNPGRGATFTFVLHARPEGAA